MKPPIAVFTMNPINSVPVALVYHAIGGRAIINLFLLMCMGVSYYTLSNIKPFTCIMFYHKPIDLHTEKSPYCENHKSFLNKIITLQEVKSSYALSF